MRCEAETLRSMQHPNLHRVVESFEVEMGFDSDLPTEEYHPVCDVGVCSIFIGVHKEHPCEAHQDYNSVYIISELVDSIRLLGFVRGQYESHTEISEVWLSQAGLMDVWGLRTIRGAFLNLGGNSKR